MASILRKAEELPAYIHGMEAFAFGFPLVTMDVTRRVLTAAGTSGEYTAPINQLHPSRQP